MRRIEHTILLLISAALGLTWIFISREPVTSRENVVQTEAPMVGHLAPDFTLNSPDGEEFTLTDFVDREGADGRPVILNYWASWCGPCRIETPELQQASLQFKDQVIFLGVNQGEDVPTVTDFGLSFGLTYPLLVDQDNRVNNLYSVRSLPTTVFIDRTGTVREVYVGVLNQGILQDRISRLLEEG